MDFTIEATCPVSKAWQILTGKKFLNQWLSKGNEIELKKNGKIDLYFDHEIEHTTQGCKIIDIQHPSEEKPFGKFVFFYKGPQMFYNTMNEFEDMWTQVTFAVSELVSSKVKITIEHTGWKSSEDWQKAKDWHFHFWSGKIDLLKDLLQVTCP